nr:MerR family transcriptional regulator [uncultured Niameybacter sp.]
MRIKEVEDLTGITSKNIRFYEKEGLITPSRNENNKYRDYSDEDVNTLKQIKLYRKLDISLEDIKLIQKGVISIEGCMEKYVTYMDERIKEMNRAKEICVEIKKDVIETKNINIDAYLDKIDNYEAKGAKFANIAKDFIKKAKGCMPPSYSYWFEPNEPIIKREDFTKELCIFADKNGLDLTILRESMEPVILIGEEKYFCMLQTPQILPFPFSIFFASHTYGFRFVYIYKYE